MRATTIWQAYRRAHALSSLHLWDKKARRNELAFLARLEKIISEYDAMKALPHGRSLAEKFERDMQRRGV